MTIPLMIRLQSKTKTHRSLRFIWVLTSMLCLCWFMPPALAMDNANPPLGTTPYPTPDIGYVTDLANILSDKQEQQLEDLLNKTETDTGVELLVVVIKSIKDYPGSANRSVESFAAAMFNDYGIGNMPQNNGILLLVCVKDRKARIELGAGYGHRYDAKTRSIMSNTIIPKFKSNNYPAGIIAGVKACLKAFTPKSTVVQKATRQTPKTPQKSTRTSVTDHSSPVDPTHLKATTSDIPVKVHNQQHNNLPQHIQTQTAHAVTRRYNPRMQGTSPATALLLIVGLVIAILIAISLFRSGKRGWGWVFVGFAIILLLCLFHIIAAFLKHSSTTISNNRRLSSDSDNDSNSLFHHNIHNQHNSHFGHGIHHGSSSFGGLGGGGSSTGGFGGHGLGGGSSGGGGATGSW